MPKRYRRRYELLLPTNFNDGTPVPDELMGQTVRELRKRFTSLSSETQHIEGHWEHEGDIFVDLNVRLFLDVDDTKENRQFFVDFKEKLKERFQQIEIWMTTYLVEVI